MTGHLVMDPESTEDYVLKGGSVWIEVGSISVFIRSTHEGVIVELFPVHYEAEGDSLAKCQATFTDAEAAIAKMESEE